MLHFTDSGFEVKTKPKRRKRRARRDGRNAVFCILQPLEGDSGLNVVLVDWKVTTVCRDESALVASYYRRLGELRLPDPDVSKSHAEVFAEKGKFFVRDLGSLNGTYLNGKRLSPSRNESSAELLASSDTVTFGRSSFTVTLERRFVAFEEEHEDEVDPLQRQLHVSVPRIKDTGSSATGVRTSEHGLMAELERHEERLGAHPGDHMDGERGADHTGTHEEGWNEVRLTAEERLRDLDKPAPSRRLRLRNRRSSHPAEEASPRALAPTTAGGGVLLAGGVGSSESFYPEETRQDDDNHASFAIQVLEIKPAVKDANTPKPD